LLKERQVLWSRISHRDLLDRDFGNAGEANTIRIGKQGTQKSTFIAGIFGTAMTGRPVVVNSNGKLGVSGTSLGSGQTDRQGE
jgi:hypothetical protein